MTQLIKRSFVLFVVLVLLCDSQPYLMLKFISLAKTMMQFAQILCFFWSSTCVLRSKIFLKEVCEILSLHFRALLGKQSFPFSAISSLLRSYAASNAFVETKKNYFYKSHVLAGFGKYRINAQLSALLLPI